ncbi:Riboflavin synthase alpha protein [Pyrenophora tritici-repentis]|nr:Riboflavin synthase alpha protein [Pyrenophora tritici-repentis]
MWDDVQRENPIRDAVDRQGHAIDRDRALGGDIAVQRRGRLDLDPVRAALRRDRDDPAQAVDMARDHVPAHFVAQTGRAFQIDAVPAFQAPSVVLDSFARHLDREQPGPFRRPSGSSPHG